MTTYTVFQEVEADPELTPTWAQLGDFAAKTPRGAAIAAVEAMSPADQAEAKSCKFLVAATSAFVQLDPPGVETKTTVSFA